MKVWTQKQLDELRNMPGMPDDLERVNCEKAGEFGHRWCGTCPEHKIPRLSCGCGANVRDNTKHGKKES